MNLYDQRDMRIMMGQLQNIACKGIKRQLQAIDGCRVRQANSLGGILGCKMAFYAYFPTARHRAVVVRSLWRETMVMLRV